MILKFYNGSTLVELSL